MKKIKSDERGTVYRADGFKIFYRKKGSISSDSKDNPHEVIYFIEGEAKVTEGSNSQIVCSPAKFEFPARKYHKIEALTDVTFLVFEKDD